VNETWVAFPGNGISMILRASMVFGSGLDPKGRMSIRYGGVPLLLSLLPLPFELESAMVTVSVPHWVGVFAKFHVYA
jgi:hypothetical protein